MECVSKKVCYTSPEEAKEALLQAHVKYRHGPVSFYLCEFCGTYHLTSKKPTGDGDLLTSEETKEELKRKEEVQHWENHFNKRR